MFKLFLVICSMGVSLMQPNACSDDKHTLGPYVDLATCKTAITKLAPIPEQHGIDAHFECRPL